MSFCNSLTAACAAGLLLALGGCASTPSETGFLSDYSKLDSDGSALRYFETGKVKTYGTFIVDPVVAHSHSGKAPTDAKAMTMLCDHFRSEIIKKLQKANFMVASSGGPGVARLRVAITDIDTSKPALNLIPQTKLLGVGLGGAAMEAEMVDSQTGSQVAAVLQGQSGSRMSFAGLSRHGDAEAVMSKWADDLAKRLKKARGG